MEARMKIIKLRINQSCSFKMWAMIRTLNFNNKVIRSGNPKMTSSAAVTSVVVGLIAGWYYKNSKVFSLRISAFNGVS